MKKIFLFSLIFLAVTALMSSCVNPDKLTFGGIESIQIKGVSTSQIGVDVGIRATNSSSHNVTLTDMQIEVKRQGATQLTINSREKSVLPRKSGHLSVGHSVQRAFRGIGRLFNLLQRVRGGHCLRLRNNQSGLDEKTVGYSRDAVG